MRLTYADDLSQNNFYDFTTPLAVTKPNSKDTTNNKAAHIIFIFMSFVVVDIVVVVGIVLVAVANCDNNASI